MISAGVGQLKALRFETVTPTDDAIQVSETSPPMLAAFAVSVE